MLRAVLLACHKKISLKPQSAGTILSKWEYFGPMATGTQAPQDQRSLLGLRSPTAFAEARPGAHATPPASPLTAQAPATPPRPDYPVISSGWDDEDTGPASKTSDLMTAVRAGFVLLAGMVALGLLIN